MPKHNPLESVARALEEQMVAGTLDVPGPARAREFLHAVHRSRTLHHPWVQPPATPAAYRSWLARLAKGDHYGHFVLDEQGELAGVINLNDVASSGLRSASLGYYAFVPAAGRGLMRAGLRQVVRRAFRDYRLQRLEANIQPGNTASKRLVESLGFRCEGFSPRYLKIAGRWRDHERWAMRAEEWRATGGQHAWR